MKTKRVLFLIWLSIYTCVGHLSQVVDELSTLSRVSNAIALQNAAAHDGLKAETFISQLYQFNEDYLRRLLDANTREVTQQIGKIYGKLRVPSPSVDGATLLNMSKPIDFLLFELPVITKADQVQHFSAKGLIEVHKKREHLRMPCKQNALLAASLFFEMTTRDSKRFKDHKDLVIVQGNIPAILDCFRAASTYAADPKGNAFEEFDNLTSTFNLYSALRKYVEDFELHEDLAPLIRKASQDVRDLKKELVGNLKIAWLGERIYDISDFHYHLQDSKKDRRVSRDGFGEVGNMNKVSGDLKSAWFREKVARGKSTAALDAALAPFYKVTEEMERLDVEVKGFLLGETIQNLIIINEMGQKLLALSQFERRASGIRRLKPSIDALGKCWSVSQKKKVNQTFLSEYEKKYDNYITVHDAMTTVIDKIVQIPQAISGLKFEKFIEKVQEVSKKFSVDHAEAKIKEYKKIELREEMEVVFQRMRDVHYAWNDYLMKMNDLHNQSDTLKEDTFSLAAAVNESRMMEYAQCLNDSHLSMETWKEVNELRKLLLAAIELRPKQAALQKYFDGLNAVEKSLDSVKRVMQTAGGHGPVLEIESSLTDARNLAAGTRVVSEMADARAQRDTFEAVGRWSKDVMNEIRSSKRIMRLLHFWDEPEQVIKPMLDGVEALEKTCADIKNSSIRTLGTVFQKARKVPGIQQYRKVFEVIPDALAHLRGIQEFSEVIENSTQLNTLDLDFARYSKALKAASTSVNALSAYFDKVFGVESEADGSNRGLLVKHPTTIEFLLGFFAILIVLLLILLIVFSSTKHGRSRMKDTFLYYFPNQTVFEKRWRYSLFLDREDGENALLNAVRDNNTASTLDAIKKGAFIDAYNLYGNTALHVATENGFAEIVELLIRNGADRSLLNSRNRTAEQCIPVDYAQTKTPEEAALFEQVERIFGKYRTSTFRIRVPREFSPQEFRILMEKRTDEMMTNQFSQKFKGITFEEATPSTTHCVCKCTKDGILETDDVELLSLMFTGVIMVRDEWMSECLHNEKLIAEDTRYLVEHVRFKGLLYKNCVLRWSCAQAKAEMPYLLGVHVMFVTGKIADLQPYISLITSLGGTIIDQPPSRKLFNSASHPYLHSHLGPAFILHDASRNVSSAWQNDDVFTVLSLDEFIVLLLKRVCRPVQTIDPPSQLASTKVSN